MSTEEKIEKRIVRGKNGGILHPFVKGQSGNPKGRPKKVVSALKVHGYSGHEINDLLGQVCAMTVSQAKDVVKNEDATLLEVCLLKMATKFIKEGRGDFLDYIISKKQSLDRTTVQVEVSNNQKEMTIEEMEEELKRRNLPKNLSFSS